MGLKIPRKYQNFWGDNEGEIPAEFREYREDNEGEIPKILGLQSQENSGNTGKITGGPGGDPGLPGRGLGPALGVPGGS